MDLYYFSWTLLIVVSLWASLAGFFWAVRHGQFKEQERARFLPLRGEGSPEPSCKVKRTQRAGADREMFVMIGILIIGSIGICAAALIAAMTGTWGRP